MANQTERNRKYQIKRKIKTHRMDLTPTEEKRLSRLKEMTKQNTKQSILAAIDFHIENSEEYQETKEKIKSYCEFIETEGTEFTFAEFEECIFNKELLHETENKISNFDYTEIETYSESEKYLKKMFDWFEEAWVFGDKIDIETIETLKRKINKIKENLLSNQNKTIDQLKIISNILDELIKDYNEI